MGRKRRVREGKNLFIPYLQGVINIKKKKKNLGLNPAVAIPILMTLGLLLMDSGVQCLILSSTVMVAKAVGSE